MALRTPALSRRPAFRLRVLSLSVGISALFLGPRNASALQPLADFVHAAQTQNFDAREQSAVMAQRHDEALQQSWKLSPVITATAGYTRNQYAAIAHIPIDNTGHTTTATIMAQNQYDVTFGATIPLVDVGAWERIGAARRTAASAVAQERATELDVQRAVAQAYFQVVATEAVLKSSNTRHETSAANLNYVQTRNAAGVAPELDLKRAEAELESTRQDVTEAEYQVRIARRSLSTVAGLEPTPGGVELSTDTSPEASLETFRAGLSTLPSVRAAAETARAAERTENATRAALYPTISATGTERFTNAVGFGNSPYYAIGATATWRFDPSTVPETSAAGHAAEAARVREARARRNADDTVYNDYQAVVRQIEKTRSAIAERDSRALALNIARQRYTAGTVNYIDVLTAERDNFAAEVSLIQACADLSYARVALHIAAGHRLEAGKEQRR